MRSRFRRNLCVDGSELARRNLHGASLVGAAMCSAVSAVRMTAGHNALRGSGPGQKPAFDNALAEIDRLCITCCSPSNLHITPDDSQRDLYYAASATGSLYRSPLAIMAQRAQEGHKQECNHKIIGPTTAIRKNKMQCIVCVTLHDVNWAQNRAIE